MKLTYLDDYTFDLMSEAELDVLDIDFGYEEFKEKELAKERLAQHSWNERTAMCGMSYGRIEELNNKMFDLEWKR
jgi:hypothetical protein